MELIPHLFRHAYNRQGKDAKVGHRGISLDMSERLLRVHGRVNQSTVVFPQLVFEGAEVGEEAFDSVV